MDTFIRIIGILRDGCEEDVQPNTVETQFTVRHDNPEGLYASIEKAMQDIFKMSGMLVAKHPGKLVKKGDVSDLKYVPMHMIARIEFVTKSLSGKVSGPAITFNPDGTMTPFSNGGELDPASRIQ